MKERCEIKRDGRMKRLASRHEKHVSTRVGWDEADKDMRNCRFRVVVSVVYIAEKAKIWYG
jgi:hypothetical protein